MTSEKIFTLTATFDPAKASAYNTVVWSSLDTSIAFVENGTITGKLLGY